MKFRLGETGFLPGCETAPITTNLAPFDPARRQDSNGAIFVKIGQELVEVFPNIKYRLEETGFLQGCEPPWITTNLAPFDPACGQNSNGAISVSIGKEPVERYCNVPSLLLTNITPPFAPFVFFDVVSFSLIKQQQTYC
jgi:hypothetical protein